ncbi:MAG TPA: glycosyltransferase family 2 protein [Smithellaceae bacterium]
MKKPSLIDTYLQNYATGEKWNLIANDTENISQVVVIPAYAEKEMLFSTLVSIAQNPLSSLEYSFILCVINNKNNSPSAVINNNLQTIKYLEALVRKKPLRKFNAAQELYPLLLTLSDAKLKFGYIDASSRGYEIPQNAGGVGMARKIGMDMALRLLKKSSAPRNLILSLDADTLVQSNYLSAIKNYFTQRVKTAIVAYEHQMPSNHEEQAAICCYEIFLRYWVLGLKYSKSPWAFHSIGSTIIVSTEAYLEVRGMNKREAGEDFYFLNKLAKMGKVGYIKETRVYPSARSSTRVPFGTGKRIQRFLSGKHQEYLLYDPQVFTILAQWLELMKSAFDFSVDEIILKAEKINPALKSFLVRCDFVAVWSKILGNVKDEKTLARQFNDWFDGLKTLKLINYLTYEAYPQIDMFEALGRILSLLGMPGLKRNLELKIPKLKEQIEIVQYLRIIT